MGKQEFDGRRAFLRDGLIIAGGLAVGLPLISSCTSVSVPATPKIEAKAGVPLYKIYGLHDTPNGGGSTHLDIIAYDINILRPRSLTLLDPSQALLEFAKEAGLSVAFRISQNNNHFDAKKVATESDKAFTHTENLVLQPYNEINLLDETGGRPMSPKEHIEQHFLPAAKLIAQVAKRHQRRARVLITPLAQRAPKVEGLDEKEYFKKMLNYLGPHLETLDVDLALGLHAYEFIKGQDTERSKDFEDYKDALEYVQKRYRDAQEILGLNLPIYVTEAGIHQTIDNPFSDKVVAKETRRILETAIPNGLLLEQFNLWVFYNYFQRPKGHQYPEDPALKKMLDGFELSALRRSTGVTEAYQQIADLVAA